MHAKCISPQKGTYEDQLSLQMCFIQFFKKIHPSFDKENGKDAHQAIG